MQTANRLKEVQEYYFSAKLREIWTLEKEGKEVLNLGIGSPDLLPPDQVIEQLKKGSDLQGANQYQSYQGLPAFREAIAKFSKNRLNIVLNPEAEILPLMGSKEGIAHISLAYLNKGDQVLIPELGYPTYTSVTKMVEAEPIYYPLVEQDDWCPDWKFFDQLDYSKIKLLYLNYPHMPTGAKGSQEILEKFVEIAIKHKLLLIHDNPYSFILNDQPLSIFSVEGSKTCALELNSLSKSFNMSGWRVGWLSGASENIKNVLRIKSNLDSGMYQPIQRAAITALQQDEKWFEQLNRTYMARRECVFRLLDKLNCTYQKAQSGLFVWAQVPVMDVDVLIDDLLANKHIFITPGHIFGAKGRRYLRVSLCAPIEVFEQAILRL
ncbi:aminotransferase class I/II-fold pyridoxal phosphate-dependent enzyme [Cyclobacteriaceae bacterium]|jgi:LL-diaminopimelate aminotransferase|nr:aminotransferase class I/II-fold pyridoxal phosphate-dependent enzyme [Cyclobacteriaceae bacterium]|tara:strand:- start:452 stop:1588 length:1137 start_codon:yes stop_codon:yes gene_type:complete